MTHYLGYWPRQQGEVGPGLPERGYWQKDEVEIATKVAAEVTERGCVIRKVGFPIALVGGEQHSHKDSQQVAGIPEADKLHSSELWELFPWFPFPSIMSCGLWATLSVQWVNSQQPVSREYFSALLQLRKMHRHFEKVQSLVMEEHTSFYLHSSSVSLPFWGLGPFSSALLLYSCHLAVFLVFSNYLLALLYYLLLSPLVCK